MDTHRTRRDVLRRAGALGTAAWLAPHFAGCGASRVPTMHLLDDLPWAAGDGWQAVRLPLLGGGLAVTAILPDEGRLPALEADLAPVLDGALATSGGGGVDLLLPRFAARSHTRLDATLAALGMPTAFTGAADLSRMTTAVRLSIGAVVHEAVIRADELGAEAAAATAVVAQWESLRVYPSARRLVFDRPFLVVLHDVPTRLPILVARIADPRRDA